MSLGMVHIEQTCEIFARPIENVLSMSPSRCVHPLDLHLTIERRHFPDASLSSQKGQHA